MRVLTEEQQKERERLEEIKKQCADYDTQYYMYKAMKKKEYEETMKIFCKEVEELMHKYKITLYDVGDGWHLNETY